MGIEAISFMGKRRQEEREVGNEKERRSRGALPIPGSDQSRAVPPSCGPIRAASRDAAAHKLLCYSLHEWLSLLPVVAAVGCSHAASVASALTLNKEREEGGAN